MKDNGDSPGGGGFRSRRSVRKRLSTSRKSHMSSSVGEETSIPGDQIRTSNPDSGEEETLDGWSSSSAMRSNIRVKEEPSREEVPISGEGGEDVSSGDGEEASSGEEDTSSGVKGSRNGETVIAENPSVTPHKRGQNTIKFNVGRSKEISENLRKQVVEAHKNGKGYKRIAKDLDLHLSTVRKIVYKWKKFSTVANLPRSGRPPKISARARRMILKHMTENTRVTAKDLKASLALDNINVHESTIRKTLNKWCSWDFNMEDTTALQQD